ncbi:MAG TPA: RidA family protein [Ramlibacter sp.]|nr:RidA family protein [Ramlibacter sp.]
MEIERIECGPRMSQAVVAGGLVFLAGQVARQNQAGDVQEQAREVLARIDALLQAAGSDRSRLVSATVWLVDMGDFRAFNEVWDAWVTPGATPTRACVQALLAQPQYKVEVAVVAGRQPTGPL